MTVAPDLTSAASAIDVTRAVVKAAARHLADNGGVDANQLAAYDLAHAAAAVANAHAMLDYGGRGATEACMTCAFAADAIFDVATRLLTREAEWGCLLYTSPSPRDS